MAEMKKLTIPCIFGNQKQPVDFYVGSPKPDNHPIQNQSHWLSSERGGTVPSEIMDSLQRLHELSKKNHVPFVDLCAYAIESSNAENDQQGSSENDTDASEGASSSSK